MMTPPNWMMVIAWGAVMAVIYYVVFRFMIRKFNYMTVGRESQSGAADMTDAELAEKILRMLGGKQNLKDISSCITRL